MAFLGTPYREIYEAKTFRAGLTDIIAYVMKPDVAKTVIGPFSMPELLPFTGLYGFDYESLVTDNPGEYLVMIFSPSENIKAADKMSLQVPSSDLSADIARLEDDINRLSSLIESIISSALPANIHGFVSASNIEGKIFDDTIIHASTDNFNIDGLTNSSDIEEGELCNQTVLTTIQE